jgi:protein-serine/threonine kinase
MDDTRYFDEEDPISDFSSSCEDAVLSPPTEADLEQALRPFNREIQLLARQFIVHKYDSARLRDIDAQINAFVMNEEQKEYLRSFVRAYGEKEKKRPRDRLLRDKEVSGKVLAVRKRGAFLGYSYRRIRRTGSKKRLSIPNRRGGVWLRQRMSIF